MKRIIKLTERDLTRIVKRVLNEQGFMLAQGNMPTVEFDDGVVNPSTFETSRKASDEEIVTRLFNDARGWSSTTSDWAAIKSAGYKMKEEMEGAGAGNTLWYLKTYVNTKPKLAALVKNWVFGGENFHSWLASEYTISWGDVVNALRPKFGSYMIKDVPVNNSNVA